MRTPVPQPLPGGEARGHLTASQERGLTASSLHGAARLSLSEGHRGKGNAADGRGETPEPGSSMVDVKMRQISSYLPRWGFKRLTVFWHTAPVTCLLSVTNVSGNEAHCDL